MKNVVTLRMHTPWGTADQVEHIADGIGAVSTSSHGGVKVSGELNRKIHEVCRCADGWYEEDCDWAIPFFVFRTEILAANPDNERMKKSLAIAEATFKEWNPDGYTAQTGIPVKREESHKMRERLFNAEHYEDWLVVAAWGGPRDGVPDGMVGCCATQGGRARPQSSGVSRWFLVPDEEYQKRGQHSFVIDLARHQEVNDFINTKAA